MTMEITDTRVCNTHTSRHMMHAFVNWCRRSGVRSYVYKQLSIMNTEHQERKYCNNNIFKCSTLVLIAQ